MRVGLRALLSFQTQDVVLNPKQVGCFQPCLFFFPFTIIINYVTTPYHSLNFYSVLKIFFALPDCLIFSNVEYESSVLFSCTNDPETLNLIPSSSTPISRILHQPSVKGVNSLHYKRSIIPQGFPPLYVFHLIHCNVFPALPFVGNKVYSSVPDTRLEVKSGLSLGMLCVYLYSKI